MLHFSIILFICSIYVLTFIIENRVHLGDSAISRFIEYGNSLSFIGKFLFYTWTITLFIALSPINFLIILYTQIKLYDKD